MRKWVRKHKKRFIAFILSFVFGVGSAFALSCPAYASSVSFQYEDITSSLTDSFSMAYRLRPVAVIDEYNEYYSLDSTTSGNTTTYSLSSAPTSGTVSVLYEGSFDVVQSILGMGSTSVSYAMLIHGRSTFAINLDSANTADDYRCIVTGTSSSTGFEGSSQCVVIEETAHKISCRNTFVLYSEQFRTNRVYVDNSIYVKVIAEYNNVTNINTLLSALSTSEISCSLTQGSQHDLVAYRSAYSEREILTTMYQDIHDTFLISDLILAQLAWNGRNNFANELSNQLGTNSLAQQQAINYASATAHADAENINNQLQGDDQILTVVSDGQSLADNRIGAVDTIIASVAPDADSAILDVSTVMTNNGTFWSSQRNASLFWKEVISDMYDSTITGFLGVGLSIVLIIILFVFILRL